MSERGQWPGFYRKFIAEIQAIDSAFLRDRDVHGVIEELLDDARQQYGATGDKEQGGKEES